MKYEALRRIKRSRVGGSVKRERSSGSDRLDICPYGHDNFVCVRGFVCQLGSDVCFRFVRSPDVATIEFDVYR